MTVRCPECEFVAPLGPGVEMTWCPCGWRLGDEPGASVVSFGEAARRRARRVAQPQLELDLDVGDDEGAHVREWLSEAGSTLPVDGRARSAAG